MRCLKGKANPLRSPGNYRDDSALSSPQRKGHPALGRREDSETNDEPQTELLSSRKRNNRSHSNCDEISRGGKESRSKRRNRAESEQVVCRVDYYSEETQDGNEEIMAQS